MANRRKQTIKQLLTWGENALQKKDIRPEEARDLLASTLNKTTSYIVGHSEDTVPEKMIAQYKDNIKKRLKGVPFSYISGTKGFYGLDFAVDETVLIPRPETEMLIDTVLTQWNTNSKNVLIDVGTGTGCIAITLAKYLPKASILATDISSRALSVAKKNAKSHGLTKRIQFKQGNLLTPIPDDLKIDLVVSNPPYLEKHELVNVPYEPVTALHGGRYGLEIIDELIASIIEREIPEAIIEISPTQAGWLEMHMREFPQYTFTFIEDDSRRTRFLHLNKKNTGTS